MNTIPTIDNVRNIYMGKHGCMCGCNGNYWYASQHQEAGSKDRGYAVTDDEVNDKKIKRMYNALKKAFDKGEVIFEAGETDATIIGAWYFVANANLFWMETKTRTNVIYFIKND